MERGFHSKMSTIFLVASFHLLVYTQKWTRASNDPCSAEIYAELPRAEYRGGACEYNKDKPTCDAALGSGWYRASGSNGYLKLQETPANVLTCGTKFAIWMNGTHPDVSDGIVNRTTLQAISGIAKTIQVKNCNDDFYVYKLEPTTSCPEAYCFGTSDSDPCPPFDPCDMYEHEWMSYDPSRSRECTEANTNSCNSDIYSKPWVAFRYSDEEFLNVSRSSVSPGGCGSTSPMWIKETISAESNGIQTETLCISSPDDSCSTTLTFRSKGCPRYNVYEVPNVTCGRLCLDDPRASCPEDSTNTDGTGILPTDPCSKEVYKMLPRADYRGGKCAYNEQKETCDAALISSWYRAVGANGNLKMRETPADPFVCGTKFPIWLNGPHPSTAAGEVKMTLSQALTNRTLTTTVKNCNDEYFIYNLQPTGSCPEAYCFGITDNDPCPPFDPCDIYEHQTVEYDPGRSSQCFTGNGYNCVRKTNLWVAFLSSGGGYLNITSKPSGIGACGSTTPMWIKETKTTAKDGIRTEKVCVESKDDDCALELQMRSKACGWFTVYELPNDLECTPLCLDDPEPSCTETTVTTISDITTRDSREREHGDVKLSADRTKEHLWIVAAILAVLISIVGGTVIVCIMQKRKTSNVQQLDLLKKTGVQNRPNETSVYNMPEIVKEKRFIIMNHFITTHFPEKQNLPVPN